MRTPTLLLLGVLLTSAATQAAEPQGDYIPPSPQLSSPDTSERPAEQRPCGPRSDMMMQLKEKFQETIKGMGITNNGAIVELTTSDSGGWTLILSFSSGMSCLIATGENWEDWRRQRGKGEKET